MKIRLYVALSLVALVALLPVACATETVTPSVTTTTTTTINPSATEPPTEEELRTQGFEHPEISRITAQKLKLMMDAGEEFILVDTRSEFVYNLGHLPGAIVITIPFLQEEEEIAQVQLLALPRDKLIVIY